ncbi:hypothetical protein C2U72_05600 [Prosthecomicrobium hirschii]|nr:hypothetical protein C2U72_05600 [Prosthecomicrobium hirschii]
MPPVPLGPALLEACRMNDDQIEIPTEEPPAAPAGELVHFNPWRDFNDAPRMVDPFGVEPDREQIEIFLDVVFGYCEGLIPVRGFVDKGQGFDGKPHNIWIEADGSSLDKLATFAAWAWRESVAVYVIPGTVAEQGHARAAEVLQMQTVVVDLDAGDVGAKLTHLVHHLGDPTLIVESGGRTDRGVDKLHVWWKLSEPASGDDLKRLCRLRADIAIKVGGDTHFHSAHQPIRVAGSVYHKNGFQRVVRIREHNRTEVHLDDLAERVAAMPALSDGGRELPDPSRPKPAIDAVLNTPVHEGGQDAWTRFEGASAAIGHYIRRVHAGEMTPDDGWEAICQYNAALLRPAWPLERLRQEADRLWRRHLDRNGPPLIRAEPPPRPTLPVFSLGALLDDRSPMPEDIIAPRVLTPGGMLVLGGAPKVGKSDLLIHLLVHMAAGRPFLGFTPPRALRVFYLQAEIQYHYLRERLQAIRLDPAVLAAARDNLIATPKLRLLLDEQGVALAADAVREAFPENPPDILCIDPIRNLFDGGPEGGSENDNAAMMFFLTERVERLREAVAPDAGLILVHHTRKMNRKLVAEDPFQALSGASALRGFYTTGLLLHRPDEEDLTRRLEIELRNGPALRAKLVDKVDGAWVELNPLNERLVRKEAGQKHDAERNRKGDVILNLIAAQAAKGKMFTPTQFAAKFENKGSLGGQTSVRERLHVLATKGHVKFLRGAAAKRLGLRVAGVKYGYLCVKNMLLRRADTVDSETGEVESATLLVRPTDFMCPETGVLLPVENPEIWVDQEEV